MRTIKQKLKKAFTITELVIVIAVIGILIAVLIPTFSNVIENAHKSTALQQSNNALKEYLALVLDDDDPSNDTPSGIVFVSDGYAHVYLNSSLHYIGETSDMPYIGTDGELRNVRTAGNVGITGISVTSPKTDDSTAVVITKAHTAGTNPEQVVGFHGLSAITAESDPLVGKTTENLYFYETTVNGTDYVGYFTLESGSGRFQLESTNYSRMSGVVAPTSAENPDDFGINLAYKSVVTNIDLYAGETLLGETYPINRTDATFTLTAKGDKTLTGLTWKSSNNNIATVADGVVTFKAGGTVTITATCEGVSAAVTIIVSNPSATVSTEQGKFGSGFTATTDAVASDTVFDTIQVTNVQPTGAEITYSVDKTELIGLSATKGALSEITVKAKQSGTAKISVKVAGLTVQTITLTVEPVATIGVDVGETGDTYSNGVLYVAASGSEKTFTITGGDSALGGEVTYTKVLGGAESILLNADAGVITVSGEAENGDTAVIQVKVGDILVKTIAVTVKAGA